MLTPHPDVLIYVSLVPIDMRKSIDGLLALVAEQLKMNPQEGNLFLFCNRDRKKVKGIYWDKNGFMLIYKRLERGRFQFPCKAILGHVEISQKELSWLLAGFNFTKMALHPELNFTDYY